MKTPGARAMSLLVALAASFAGAQTLTWEHLVGGYVRDLSLNAAKGKVGELEGAQGLQLWDDLELRYGAKRSDLRKQEFGLRVSPAGLGELRANRNLSRARRGLGEAVLYQKTAEAIRDRYKLALDWRFQALQRVYHLEMADMYAQRIAALARLVSDERFDPEDLVKAQVRRAEYLAKAEGDVYKLAQIEHHMRQFVPGMGEVRLDGELKSPLEIDAVLSGVDPSRGDSFPDIRVPEQELSVVRAKTDQEVASSRRWISYVEVGYTVDVDENSKEERTHRDNISFGAGVKIPLFDGSSREIARRRADLAEARLDYQDDREDIERLVAELRLSIGSMARQVAVLDSFASKVDAGGLFADFALKSGGDPLLLLSARQTSIENRWMIDELRFLMLYDYLEILYNTGILVRNPTVNHLLAANPKLAAAPEPTAAEKDRSRTR